MSKNKKTPDVPVKASAKSAPPPVQSHAIRETVESIVIAFVLAFLFRTFEAEAFVIPTGSMAPTLMGQHKDLECPECGFRFQVGVRDTDPRMICPNCRYRPDYGPKGRDGEISPRTYNGDRIIV